MEEQEMTALPLEGGVGSEELVHPMSELLDEAYSRIVPERGEVIEGTIVSMGPSEILVDIGCKSEGIVPARDLERLDPEFRAMIKVGLATWVYVLRPEDAQGNIIVSLSRAQLETDWQKAAKLFESGDVVEEEVTGCNRGGLIVNIGRVRGFVPASQVFKRSSVAPGG